MPTSRCAGIDACSCVDVQLAKARAEGAKDSKIEKMRPACKSSCHRYRLKAAWAMRVNRGTKVMGKTKCGRGEESARPTRAASMMPGNNCECGDRIVWQSV